MSTQKKKKFLLHSVYEWEAELGAAPGHLSLAHFIQLVQAVWAPPLLMTPQTLLKLRRATAVCEH